MKRFDGILSKSLWKSLFAGPLRVRITLERPDGTEVYHFYPLDSDTVVAGQRVHVDFEVGMTLTEV